MQLFCRMYCPELRKNLTQPKRSQLLTSLFWKSGFWANFQSISTIAGEWSHCHPAGCFLFSITVQLTIPWGSRLGIFSWGLYFFLQKVFRKISRLWIEKKKHFSNISSWLTGFLLKVSQNELSELFVVFLTFLQKLVEKVLGIFENLSFKQM